MLDFNATTTSMMESSSMPTGAPAAIGRRLLLVALLLDIAVVYNKSDNVH